MSKPNVRRSALLSLLALDRPIEDLRNELANFAWDDAPDLVKLTRDHIRVILQRFLAGQISAETVEAWAETIEIRDDIDFAEDEQVIETIFILANPGVNGELDNRLAKQILSNFSNRHSHGSLTDGNM
jgi:reverse gyrase